MKVTNRTMAADATYLRILPIRMPAFDRVHSFLMAFPASLFGYCLSVIRDADVVFEPAGREVIGMPESVAGFGRVLGDKLRRRVAIVADGDVAMAGLEPGAVLVLHHMTIGAGLRVISEIRITASVDKGVGADADGEANCHAQDDSVTKAKSRQTPALKPMNAQRRLIKGAILILASRRV